MSTNKTIYIIRHGETDYNRKGIIQGSGINSSLNTRGVEQAAKFYEAYKHLPFNRVYTSELKRTHQSVELFLKNGHAHERLTGLNEINWGVFEGVQGDDYFKMRYNEIVSRWRDGFLDEPIEGGESPLDMYQRQQKAFDEIMSKQDESLILICMHGRALRSFLSLILNTPLSDMDDYPHSNLCLYVIEIEGDKSKLIRSNDINHLN